MFGFLKKLFSFRWARKKAKPKTAAPAKDAPLSTSQPSPKPGPPAEEPVLVTGAIARMPPQAKALSADDYARQKMAMVGDDATLRRGLAQSDETHPEILYYLSADTDAGVRLAVAKNAATPLQAGALLAKDPSIDVRLALAARLVALLPGLALDQQSQLYAFTVQALGILAGDEVLKIRKALATALKDLTATPPKVAGQLARDLEREVSEPVLRYCAALSDEDMLDLLGHHPASWVVEAIAGRAKLSDAVSRGVIGCGDVPGGVTLLRNEGAVFSPETLQAIVDRARSVPEWHEPVVMRRELSLDAARQLSGFVSAAVMSLLERRTDFDAVTRQVVSGMVARRMEFRRLTEACGSPEERVEVYARKGILSAEVISDALAWGEADFAIGALARLARVHPHVARKMLATQAAKPAVALCWKAGMPMRMAIEVQRELARVPSPEIVYAKNGTDYPLTEQELHWQLEFFGIYEK